jgi:hypothetical protein
MRLRGIGREGVEVVVQRTFDQRGRDHLHAQRVGGSHQVLQPVLRHHDVVVHHHRPLGLQRQHPLVPGHAAAEVLAIEDVAAQGQGPQVVAGAVAGAVVDRHHAAKVVAIAHEAVHALPGVVHLVVAGERDRVVGHALGTDIIGIDARIIQ